MIIMSWTKDYDEEREEHGRSTPCWASRLSFQTTIPGREAGRLGGPVEQGHLFMQISERIKDIVSTPSHPAHCTHLTLKFKAPFLISGSAFGNNHVPQDSPLWTSPTLDLKYLSVFPKTSTLSSTILTTQLKWLNTGTALCNLQSVLVLQDPPEVLRHAFSWRRGFFGCCWLDWFFFSRRSIFV